MLHGLESLMTFQIGGILLLAVGSIAALPSLNPVWKKVTKFCFQLWVVPSKLLGLGYQCVAHLLCHLHILQIFQFPVNHHAFGQLIGNFFSVKHLREVE